MTLTLDTAATADATSIKLASSETEGLIESTNNLYASSPVKSMLSNSVDLAADNALLNSSLNINEGSFKLIVYDIDGNISASRDININVATTMSGTTGNSIEEQIAAQLDDNGDGNANNDIDDFFLNGFSFAPAADGALKLALNINAQQSRKDIHLLCQTTYRTLAILQELTLLGQWD